MAPTVSMRLSCHGGATNDTPFILLFGAPDDELLGRIWFYILGAVLVCITNFESCLLLCTASLVLIATIGFALLVTSEISI